MNNPPKTREEAEKIKYGEPKWAIYSPLWCAYQTDTFGKFQCIRKPGRGPSGLYCWQHAKMVEKQDG